MAKSSNDIVVTLDRFKLRQTLTILPVLIVLLSVITYLVVDFININQDNEGALAEQQELEVSRMIESEIFSYPVSGSDLNPNLFTLHLPPPPLDAIPYDVRVPLSNGGDVPAKRRWLWVPPEQAITVTENEGNLNVDIPEGTMWWKEFYVETDRGVFLIERRIVVRVQSSQLHPNGWALYTAYNAPRNTELNTPIIVSSISDEAIQYMFQADEWLPTQSIEGHTEIRFEDVRGTQYAYLFPGTTQCTQCHNGAAGAYPNNPDDPIFVFGLHPNNFTAESYITLVERGWIVNGDRLLTQGYLESEQTHNDSASFEEITRDVLGVIRNNCASCHNNSRYAPASITSFVIDPNHNYSADELIDLLSVNGFMFPDANPLITLGNLEESELWLRINGLDGRRRMPPIEGGLPEIDSDIVDLFEEWIMNENN